MGKRAANPTTVSALRILRKARKAIASGDQIAICFAIFAAAGRAEELADQMTDHVMASIRPEVTFGCWARERGLPSDGDSRRRMRLAYLDAWIAKHEQAIARQQRGVA